MGLGFKRFCFKSDVLSEGLLSGLGFKQRLVKGYGLSEGLLRVKV